MWVIVLGCVAAFLSSFALVPQAIRVFQTKEVEQLSLPTFSMMTAGATLWLFYGVFKSDWVIIGANAVVLVFTLYIGTVKISSLRKARTSESEK